MNMSNSHHVTSLIIRFFTKLKHALKFIENVPITISCGHIADRWHLPHTKCCMSIAPTHILWYQTTTFGKESDFSFS